MAGSNPRGSPLESLHEERGARFVEVGGRRVPRNFGDPAAEYDAVRSAAAVADRADRVPLRVTGREPVKMIQGLITNDIEGAPEGRGVYAALLTPKGRLVADLRAFRLAGGELLLDVDAGALPAALEHFRKYVPPLFAKVEDASDRLHVLGVYGPRARETVERVVGVALPAGMPEEAFARGGDGGADRGDADRRDAGGASGSDVVAGAAGVARGGADAGPDAASLVVRTAMYGEDGYDVFVPADRVESVWRGLIDAGARPVGYATLDVLRIEAGRPRWSAELDDTVIPLEAGLRERAISTTKGCYTGQEVIIRILHRGHVNRHLRGVRLGDVPVPAKGATLVRPDAEKPVGWITSACYSPLHEQTIALAYVRREVEPPAVLRLGAPDGPEAEVVELPIPIVA